MFFSKISATIFCILPILSYRNQNVSAQWQEIEENDFKDACEFVNSKHVKWATANKNMKAEEQW